MGELQIQRGYFFFQKQFQAAGRALFHKSLYLADGNIQLPQQQNGFQDRALKIAVTAVSVFRMNKGGFKQPDLIVPHQSFFVDSMHGCKLTDGEKLIFSVHNLNFP